MILPCTACGHRNLERAKFCLECGAPTTRACGQCGTTLPGGAKFCLECGRPVAGATAAEPSTRSASDRDPRAYTPKHLAEKILQSKSALEGERKQVTVLFADVKGSMELAEQLDPEEWHRVLERFFGILTDGVHRFEGTVNQYTGDGIMALFGAPIAHEDHAQRACYAALHLRDALREFAREVKRQHGLDFPTRIGLNSGEVVVGKIGDDLRMDYTAQGHTVGLAQRMEALASGGSIYLSAATAALAQGYVQLDDLGAMRIKGASEPVQVFELTGTGALRTRFDVSRARGLSKFVGRADEMATLEAALERAMAGQGCVVGVVAEPGTGKSRLCFEFAERARARGIAVREAQAVPHGKQVPFLPVLELLRAAFGIAARDSDADARQKIAGALVLLDAGFERSLPVWFELLGVPDPNRPAPAIEGEERERLLLEGMRRWLLARSARSPVVVLLEDLHWFDGASERVVETLVGSVREARALLLLDFRPEYRAGWMQHSWYQQLPLSPLDAAAATELLRDVLGRDPTLESLADRIAAHAGGNPFFVEELVQSLVEQGGLVGERGAYRLGRPIEALALPSSVQGVLASRIDRLAERDKRLLQAAAVLGGEFDARVLARVAELDAREVQDALRKLTDAEFVHVRSLYPDVVYAFKHPLSQEVAYQSQLSARRTERHRGAALALEALTPTQKLDERAADIARHWQSAGDALHAVRWHARAAAWSEMRAPLAAIEQWREVRRLCDQLPVTEEVATLGVRACARILALGSSMLDLETEEVESLYSAGREIAERVGGAVNLAYLHYAFGFAGTFVRDSRFTSSPIDIVREAIAEAGRHGDASTAAAARAHLVVLLREHGRLAEAVAEADRLLEEFAGRGGELKPNITGANPLVAAIGHRAVALMDLGRLDEAGRELDRCLELSAARGDSDSWIWLGFRVDLACLRGDAETAVQDALRAMRGSEEVGTSIARGPSFLRLGAAHVLREDWQAAVEAWQRAEEEWGSRPRPHGYRALAYAQLRLGDFDAARASADERLRNILRTGWSRLEPPAQLEFAQVLLEAEGLDEEAAIEAALTRAQQLVDEMGGIVHQPFIHLVRADLAKLKGDVASRERHLREAQLLFVQIGAPLRAAAVARDLPS